MPPPAKIPVPPVPEKRPAGALRLKRWTFAGFLLTYWCNARCAFCYVYSGPEKKGPLLGIAQALGFWRDLNRLVDEGGPSYGQAGERFCKVHFAGGEPFFQYPHLLALATAAHGAGLKLLEKIETNAFWATSDELVGTRLRELQAVGLKLLLISADVYHQEFVPIERCLRAARIAREVLGEEGVRVRWWDFVSAPLDIARMSSEQRQQAFARALVQHRERLLGRAADQLADYYETHPPEHFCGQSCPESTLGSRHVHIDGYGHVTPGVCAGILWGTVQPVGGNGEWTFPSLYALWQHASGHWAEHPIISRVVAGGSYELYQYARTVGFVPRVAGYANKCHLCHEVRRFLYQQGHFRGVLGPAEVYAEGPVSSPEQRVPLPVLGAAGGPAAEAVGESEPFSTC